MNRNRDGNKRPQSEAANKARRENAKHSTGPRTEMGKDRVRLNALKTGFHADKAAYRAMIALGENPEEYARIYTNVLEELVPQNSGQVMLAEDVAVIRWQQNRNQRGQAGLIGKAQEELARRHSQQWKTYEQLLDDAPEEQVIAHGLASLPDSKGKLERIRDLLKVAVEGAEKGKYEDVEAVLEIIYGKESESRRRASLRDRVESLRESPKGTTARQEKEWLLDMLREEQLKWTGAALEYLETIRPPSQAELNACFVPQGKAWRATMRQAAWLDQRLEKKMRLYWEAQKKDRERLVRMHEEAKLEAAPEEVAAEQEATQMIANLTAAIQELDAKMKAAEEELRAANEVGAGSARPVGGTSPVADSTSDGDEKPQASASHVKTTPSTTRQKPAGEPIEARSGSSVQAPTKLTEQSGESVENKGAGSENKPETKLNPGS